MSEETKMLTTFVIQHCVALGTLLVCAALYYKGLPIPAELGTAAVASNTFVFGQKVIK